MRILILNWRDVRHPDSGGAELYLQETGSRWANEGHEVSLFSASFAGSLKEEEIGGVKIQRIGNKYTVYLGALRRFLSSQRKYSFDVIFESINTVPFFSPLFSKSPVVGLIFSLENKSVLLQEMSSPMMPVATLAYLFSSAIPIVYRSCEVTTISNSSKEILVNNGFNREQIHVAYPGLSDRWSRIVRYTNDVERPNHTIVSLGRLKRYKGVQDIIRAIPLVMAKIPDIKLRIIGKGDFEPALRRIVSSLGISDSVDFCGFVSEEEKAIILKESSLYVCSSRDEGGWTIAAVEAMSAGLPVLVTKSQIDVLDNGKTGRLLENEEPETLAQKIISLLLQPELWSSLSANAQRFSQKFTWEETAFVTLKALKKASTGRLAKEPSSIAKGSTFESRPGL